ncbi:MAG TPA: tRNA 2-thiouridine(34) synthase MnmA [Candidatus Saccharimonadales bacterium]|nr:tRNA 2-thiouridine(34) synthase MnmA [Candidatus Saccharimonadales bacterium]
MSQKVYVGMSGGVDSSVTAALLKQQGFDVTGVYMKNWSEDFPGFICPWQEDYLDAKRVAVELGITFKLFDFEKQYRHKVVNYMVSEYQAGRTPNPDVMCNQEVKFKLFLDTSIEDGAELIATGHYARINDGQLLTGLDPSKDQSYFLYRVTAEALRKSLMPIGEYHKSQVRVIAKKLKLYTADKKDSQGICFVGKVGIKEFLLNELGPQTAGPILDQEGKEIGQHDGAIFYTIGQRHGLQVGGGLPYYVTHKNIKNNSVSVTTNLDDPELWHKEISLRDIHWINVSPQKNKSYLARLRYRGPLVPCSINKNKLILNDEQRGLAAGQSAVIYDGEICLGGGIMS